MGAYLSAALSMGPYAYFPLDDVEYANPDTGFITRASVYPGTHQYTTFAQVGFGTPTAGPSLVAGEAAALHYDYNSYSTASDPSEYDFAGENRNTGFNTFFSASGPTYVGPQMTHVVTIARETNYAYTYENGLIYYADGRSNDDRMANFLLRHVENVPTLELSIEGYWNDVYNSFGNNWYGYAVKHYDTGIPVDALLDGRPHLLAFRVQSFAQAPAATQQPLPTTAWIEVWIDGTLRYTCPLGPGWGNTPQKSQAVFRATKADEWAFYSRHLSPAEIATLWSNWGSLSDWPIPASSRTRIETNTPDAGNVVIIIGHPDDVENFGSASSADHKWFTADKDAEATGDAIFPEVMGQGTWVGNDPWNSTRDRGLASKWLDMEADVDLLAVPIRGVATVYADLERQEGLVAGTSSGQSSVSGDLTVAIPLEAGEIHGSSTVYAITIGDLVTMAAASSGVAIVSADLSHGQTEPLAGSSSGGSSVEGDLLVTRYTLVTGEEVDHNGMPMGPGGRRRSHFTPLSVGHVSDRAQGITTAGAGVGIDGIGLGS